MSASAQARVPFLDLRVQHDPLMPELLEAFRQVTEASAFAGGPFVARFEKEFAAFCKSRYALGVGSGTDALWLSLLALGVGPGDEVITVPNSFMATAEAISLCGARPVFVDIDETTYTMDPVQLEAAITLRLGDHPGAHLRADGRHESHFDGRSPLWFAGSRRYLPGAWRKLLGQTRQGASGLRAVLAFIPGRTWALSEKPERSLPMRLTSTREFRCSPRTWSSRQVYALRDRLECSHGRHSGRVGSVKLAHLNAGNEARRAHARRYNDLLADDPRIIRPEEAAHRQHVFHIYAVRVRAVMACCSGWRLAG